MNIMTAMWEDVTQEVTAQVLKCDLTLSQIIVSVMFSQRVTENCGRVW